MGEPNLTLKTNANQAADSIDAVRVAIDKMYSTRIKLDAIAHLMLHATHSEFDIEAKRLIGLGDILDDFVAEFEKWGEEATKNLLEAKSTFR